jgi:hypothetical protein
VKRTVLRNIHLIYNVRGSEQLPTFASKEAKEMRRTVMRKVHLTCDVG